MAGRHRATQGYLGLKPAGALSRLKGRRRLWFVLEEGRLLYFRSEGDREPLGHIDTRAAAISLAQDNHFVLHSNGREHVLVADDHDSMMLWILAIQQDKPEPQQDALRLTVQRTHSLPPQLDALRRMRSATLNDQSSPHSESAPNSSSSSSDSDAPDARVRLLRKMNAEAHSSFSGTSVSSDSAVGTSECSASVRLQELESELVCTKCDLAKALNRESAYKSIIEEKILLVNELEERLRSAEDPLWPPREKPEKCRILQNHNRFLNEEVLKLARILQHEKKSADHNQHQMRQLESEVERLKRDYVFLMQSSLRINNCDGPETIEVYLYGGNRHKERVVALLEEARRINPTLPVYENLSRGLPHVDSLGFRHAFSDESLTLHYICRQLHLHYSAVGQHQHHQHWKRHLRHNPALEPSKELKGLVRAGVPLHLRSRVWAALCRARVRDLIDAKGPHYYNFLCTRAPDDERVTHHKRQIALDLLRTMPDNIRFADANADGVRKMQEVLQAFCVHNPALGYCQGMNFLVGMSLLFLEPEDAFWCLVSMCERSFTAHYFDGHLLGAQADQEVLKELVGERLPDLARHFARHDIELATVTLNWFLAVFFDCVPFEVSTSNSPIIF
ncbi:hypothetical protein JTE90_016771 [Oedothorax gibbosus]|uniref:TBC1 domain family member 2B n=1 Tax=Oedothorax gibbosus TaxID=931172 RepID=A0AAV6W029_9ARAC|nr:hypothetical protein JTE90_016771 [Oedothorax gibbosus]